MVYKYSQRMKDG